MSFIVFKSRKNNKESINFLEENFPLFDRLFSLKNSLIRGDTLKIKEVALNLKEADLKEYIKSIYLIDYYIVNPDDDFEKLYDDSDLFDFEETIKEEDSVKVVGYPKHFEKDIVDYIKKNNVCKIDKNSEKVLYVINFNDEYHYGLYDKKYLLD